MFLSVYIYPSILNLHHDRRVFLEDLLRVISPPAVTL